MDSQDYIERQMEEDFRELESHGCTLKEIFETMVDNGWSEENVFDRMCELYGYENMKNRDTYSKKVAMRITH